MTNKVYSENTFHQLYYVIDIYVARTLKIDVISKNNEDRDTNQDSRICKCD